LNIALFGRFDKDGNPDPTTLSQVEVTDTGVNATISPTVRPSADLLLLSAWSFHLHANLFVFCP
jgi:hypothetical protein